jgi:hypothetical protein
MKLIRRLSPKGYQTDFGVPFKTYFTTAAIWPQKSTTCTNSRQYLFTYSSESYLQHLAFLTIIDIAAHIGFFLDYSLTDRAGFIYCVLG